MPDIFLLEGANTEKGAPLVAQTVKNPPAMQETWVRSLGWEDLLEEEMATHSSILAWKIPCSSSPGWWPPSTGWSCQGSGHRGGGW